MASRILFTRASGIGSRLIRAVTKEDVSHVALQVGGFVIHSRLLKGGILLQSREEFDKHAEVVHSLPFLIYPENIDRKKYKGRFYDVGGLLYLGIRLLLRNWLGIPVPKQNLWQSTGMYMCQELVTDILYGEEASMLTPGQLYDLLSQEEQ